MKNKFDTVFISNNPNEKRSDAMFWEEYLEDETEEVEEKKGVDIWDIIFKGGPGSGNFGHAGRPGQIGGSGGGGGTGGGKSTGVNRLSNRLTASGFKTSFTEEGYGVHVHEGKRGIVGTFQENKDNSFTVESVSSAKLHQWILDNGGSTGKASEGRMHLPEGSISSGGQAGSLQEGKRKPKRDMMIEDVKLFDKKKYRTLSATEKVNMTAKYLNKYKSNYVLKKDWDKATEKLSSKDKKIWLSYNKGIGALEGVRVAKIKDGNKQQGKTRRKYYNMAVGYQDSARIMAFNRDTFHTVS